MCEHVGLVVPCFVTHGGGDGLCRAYPFGGGCVYWCLPVEPPCTLDCERVGGTLTYRAIEIARIAATVRFACACLSVPIGFL